MDIKPGLKYQGGPANPEALARPARAGRGPVKFGARATAKTTAKPETTAKPKTTAKTKSKGKTVVRTIKRPRPVESAPDA